MAEIQKQEQAEARMKQKFQEYDTLDKEGVREWTACVAGKHQMARRVVEGCERRRNNALFTSA